ncbi:MAG: hypothetical protein HOV80_18185 [Polyangiaceae bacterium]|nr:hypothetical protein [Polyangiaceae bacterium]
MRSWLPTRGLPIVVSVVALWSCGPSEGESDGGTAGSGASAGVGSSTGASVSTGAGPSTTGSGGAGTGGGSGACPRPKRVITSAEVEAQTNSGYPVGTELVVPGSSDPWGGCFPNEENTGIPSGTTLTNYDGPCNITEANTIIEGKTISCSLTISAANVTIRSSKIEAGNIQADGGAFLLEDSEVDFGNNPNDEGLKGTGFTVRRVNMYGGKRQVWCDDCLLEDSYLHDQLSDPTGVTHESAVRVEQNAVLRHNSFLCNAPNFPPDAGCSANQTGYPDFSPIHGNTMEKNLYLATTGGFCSYGGATAGKPFSDDPSNATNIHSISNVFQRGTSPNDRESIPLTDKRRYTCGSYGVVTDYDSSLRGFEFTGNMWDDGLLFKDDSEYPYGSWLAEMSE